jgi:hypothetical protein
MSRQSFAGSSVPDMFESRDARSAINAPGTDESAERLADASVAPFHALSRRCRSSTLNPVRRRPPLPFFAPLRLGVILSVAVAVNQKPETRNFFQGGPMSHTTPSPSRQPPGERLARLEAQNDQLLLAVERARADLHECVEWQRRICETQDARFNSLETAHEETRTHLKWIKAVWFAVQSTVIGWISLKQ